MASVDTTILYVAIDFGTTFSGYAFKFKLQKKIFVNNNWANEIGYNSYKVPTCVLTKGDSDEFVDFGFNAQSKYSDDDSDNEDSDNEDDKDKPQLHFYDEFKMLLEGEKGVKNKMKIAAFDGHECEATKIFAMALAYLKKHLLDHIAQQFHTVPKDEEIKWVLTVPAIWSDSAKHFMRECALESGLVRKDSSIDQLLIALEPEAASLYCRTLPLSEFELKQNIPDTVLDEGLPRDSHYMVVDCGGGTVDVTAHHYKKNGEICELYAASGGGWGGRNIHKRFEEKLDDVIGEDFIQTCQKHYSSVYLETKVKFEKEKRSIDFGQKNMHYHFVCPYVFDSICQNKWERKLDGLVEEHFEEHSVRFTTGTLIFPKPVMEEMFKPSIDAIKGHILGLIEAEELKEVKYIYLVGGFSDCSLLQSEIKEEFQTGPHKSKNIHIVLAPTEASLAVVKGAVLFGENPHAISSRRARRSYCTEIDNGRGRKVLKPVIKQNDEIDNDDIKHTHFDPSRGGNIFKLYHYRNEGSTKPKTMCSTDKNVGLIEVDVSKLIGSKSSAGARISVYLHFGSTEIHVTARNDKSPDMKQVKQSINFADKEGDGLNKTKFYTGKTFVKPI